MRDLGTICHSLAPLVAVKTVARVPGEAGYASVDSKDLVLQNCANCISFSLAVPGETRADISLCFKTTAGFSSFPNSIYQKI